MTETTIKKLTDNAYPGRGGASSPLGEVECLVRRAGFFGHRTFHGAEGKPYRLWLPNGPVEEVVSGISVPDDVSGSNIVVNRFKTQMSHLTVGHETSTRFTNKMAWGTGGHAVGDPTSPIAPSETDTALEAQVLIKNLATFDFPTGTSVRMIAFILESEANGFTITEEGLVSADNTLVARRTFPGLPKTSDFVFEFRHTIVF